MLKIFLGESGAIGGTHETKLLAPSYRIVQSGPSPRDPGGIKGKQLLHCKPSKHKLQQPGLFSPRLRKLQLKRLVLLLLLLLCLLNATLGLCK